jgi:hypothetical protein
MDKNRNWSVSKVRKVDLVLRCPTGQVKKSDSQTCRYDGQIYFHWYKILGLLYKRALFMYSLYQLPPQFSILLLSKINN